MKHPPLVQAAVWLLFGVATCVNANALLHCDVTYAGATQVLETPTVTTPYAVPSVDIGGRFWFKAVMVGQAARVDYVKLYAYSDTPAQPLLLQEAVFLPPFQASATPYPLTGTQRLYAGTMERELLYSCTLQGVQP